MKDKLGLLELIIFIPATLFSFFIVLAYHDDKVVMVLMDLAPNAYATMFALFAMFLARWQNYSLVSKFITIPSTALLGLTFPVYMVQQPGISYGLITGTVGLFILFVIMERKGLIPTGSKQSVKDERSVSAVGLKHKTTMISHLITGAAGVAAALITVILTAHFYYAPLINNQGEQINILREQNLLMNKTLQSITTKQAQLIMQVYPNYSWELTVQGQTVFTESGRIGHTDIVLKNSTLALPKHNVTTFTIFISNVGSNVAQIIFFAAIVEYSDGTSTSKSPESLNKILKPNDVPYEIGWNFQPTRDEPAIIHFIVYTDSGMLRKDVEVRFY